MSNLDKMNLNDTQLSALEQSINPPKEKGKSKGQKKGGSKFPRPPRPPIGIYDLYRRGKSKFRRDPTYAKLAATSAVAASFTDAELQQHMIARGIADYPDPSSNAVARHLAVGQLATDLMDHTYPREAAYLDAIGGALGEPDRVLIASDDDDDDDWLGIGEPIDDDDDEENEGLFGETVAREIAHVCESKAVPLDAATRDILAYSTMTPEAKETALLSALAEDKHREADHVARDSETVATGLEQTFAASLPADLRADVPAAMADAFHVAVVDEVNRASLESIKVELGEAERENVAAMDRKAALMVSVLEDQQPTDDAFAAARQQRRLEQSYGKLRGYFLNFSSPKQAKLRDLFGRMSRFVRGIPSHMRAHPVVRKALGAMAVAASLSSEQLADYDTAGILRDHPAHAYGQQLLRHRIAADLLAMSDVHGARRTAAIGAALAIGDLASDLQGVKLRPVRKIETIPPVDDMRTVLDRALGKIRTSVEPDEAAADEVWDTEIVAPQPLAENATIVPPAPIPVAPPALVAEVVADEKAKTAAVDEKAAVANAVIATVDVKAEQTAAAVTTAAMDRVPAADAADVPPSVLLSYIASMKEVIKTEEFKRLQAEVKSAAERRANEQLAEKVASLTRILEQKSKAPVVSTTPGTPVTPTAPSTTSEVFSLPTEAAETIKDEKEKQMEKVEDALDEVKQTKRGSALSFFKSMMGETGRGSAGFLKEILPSLSSGAAEVTSGVTSAGVEGLGNVGVTAATTYADRRAAKQAFRATPEGRAQYEAKLSAKRERVQSKGAHQAELAKVKAARKAELKAAKKSKMNAVAKNKSKSTNKSKPRAVLKRSSKSRNLKALGISAGVPAEEALEIACSECDARGAETVTHIGCASCGATYEYESSSSSDSSTDDDDDLEITAAVPADDDDDDDFFDIGADEAAVGMSICGKLGCKDRCREAEGQAHSAAAYECKSCGMHSKKDCAGIHCGICGRRTDGCDECALCNDAGCETCRRTSPAARLAVYRAKLGIKAAAPVNIEPPMIMPVNIEPLMTMPAEVSETAAPAQIGGHLCYGAECPVCELRAKYGKTADVSAKAIGAIIGSEGATIGRADPLAGVAPPVFVLSPWGMFELRSFAFPLLLASVESDWQFPPALSAARVLAVLQQSAAGAAFALLVMDRLCLFLTIAPRMNPALAPGAVELVHRVAETQLASTLPPVAAPFTQDEIDWIVEGVGSSFRSLTPSAMWAFLYELIVGLLAADDRAALMYRTILSYHPLMSLVEAKKYREATEARDQYTYVAARLEQR